MKHDFPISKRFLWFNRIGFLAIYALFVFLSFMFRGNDNHVYDIVYLLLFHGSIYYLYVVRMKLQIEGKELHYKPYNTLLFRSQVLDGNWRCKVVRRWGVDAVRMSTSDGKRSMIVYPEDIPAFLQAVREIAGKD